MKVDIVGCHCTWTEELSTSFVIDDTLVIDLPQDSFKKYYTTYDISKLKYIFITHFHSDHFLSLPNIIEVMYKFRAKDITIVAPKTCKERLIQIVKLIELPHLENYINENFTFIECENNKKFSLGKYKVKTFKMFHNLLDAYGYVIEKDGIKIGFTGDTAMCNSVIKIIKASKAVFIDAAGIEKNNKHLSASEVFSLCEEFPQVQIVPIHMSTYSKEVLKEKIKIPFQGQIFNIE